MSKLEKLRSLLLKLKRVVVAYSGGLDSTFLLKAAIDALGRDNVIAVTARSQTYPLSEFREARAMAKKLGARHITIKTDELKVKNFRSNPVNRCYYCKKELFKRLDAIKERYAMAHVLDGTNLDDLKDIRYGSKAAQEWSVRRPLLEAGITKGDIRKFSKSLRLQTWNKPSFACLASRIPFYTEIKEKDLARIAKAEDHLRSIGFRQNRVRLHNSMARLEVSGSDFRRALRLKDGIIKAMRSLGFVYVTLDLAGYRTGSMHEAGGGQ
jgi:uncharacterized protein